MEEELIDDIVGDLRYTDSQKSIAASLVEFNYSMTDTASASYGHETYTLDIQDSDESEESTHSHPTLFHYIQPALAHSSQKTILQETYTQTSKTIIQLAESDKLTRRDIAHLDTQTSTVSITENKSIQYRIEYSSSFPTSRHCERQIDYPCLINKQDSNQEQSHELDLQVTNKSSLDAGYETNLERQLEAPYERRDDEHETRYDRITEVRHVTTLDSGDNKNNQKQLEYLSVNAAYEPHLTEKPDSYDAQSPRTSFDDDSSKYRFQDTDERTLDSSNNEEIRQIEEPEKRNKYHSSRSERDKFHCDMEPDSLKGRQSSDSLDSDLSVPKSVDDDVEELYTRLSGNIDIRAIEVPEEAAARKKTLTPLTEESVRKCSSSVGNAVPANESQLLNSEDFQTFNGINVKILADEKGKEEKQSKDSFKLPPIKSSSNPSSTPGSNNISLLFTSTKNFGKTDALPSLQEINQSPCDPQEDRIMAAGESCKPSSKNESPTTSIQLPPIHLEGSKTRSKISPKSTMISGTSQDSKDPITIHDKIQELKGTTEKARTWKHYSRKNTMWTSVRSSSPSSCTSPVRSEIAERGCDVLCVEIIRKLRFNQNWVEVVETLDDMLHSLEKYWSLITEHRTAELIRQVCVHVECPRTLVARAACNTLAGLIKNTNYTRKPDFYEAVSILLSKTGSYSRPIRRAANVALDVIVSGVDVSHAIIALTVHGVNHKSPLVRVCVSRLLVVGCALSGGGRSLLRPRPPHAAVARRAALSALSRLLEDKHYDARKYAERLYLMLRPLQNFESYYLTDVNVELATKQIKKYDQMLMFGLVTKTQSR